MALLSTQPLGLRLTDDGDLYRGTTRMEMIAGIDAVVQAVRVRLQFYRGEWFADLGAGVPYLERDGVPASAALLGQHFSRAKAVAAFRAAILDTPGIVEILSLVVAFDGATRSLSVTWSALCVFGETDLETLEIDL